MFEYRLRNAPKDVKEQVSQCSKNAKTVIAHAKCVSNLIDGKLAQEKDVRRAPIRNKKTKNKKVLPSASEYQAFMQGIGFDRAYFCPLFLR